MRLLPRWLRHRVGRLARRAAAHGVAAACEDPARAQQRRLRAILRRSSGTFFGREHGFENIRGADAYRAHVPLMDPATLAGLVARGMAGERGLLTAERPEYYVQTTGTTGRPRYLPITPSFRGEYRQALLAATWHLEQRLPEAFAGDRLHVTGSSRGSTSPDGTPVGAFSSYNLRATPTGTRGEAIEPSPEVRDLRARRWLTLHLATVGRPSLITGSFPVPLVLLLRDLEEQADALAWHVEHGRLPDDLVLDDARRAAILSRLRPDPEAGRRLRRAARAPVGRQVQEAWPSLRLVWCWTGGSASLYVPELKRRLGASVALRDACYGSAEGFLTSPLGTESPGGPVCPTAHFYEFIDVDAFTVGHTSTVLLHELEIGRRYVPVVTTSAGLYRHVLGDVVEVTGIWRDTPAIRFVRKASAVSNLVGERLEEPDVTFAVGGALAERHLDPVWFTMTPESGHPPHYVCYLELPHGAEPPANLDRRIDERLRAVARGYDIYRRDRHIGPLRVRYVPQGTLERWRQARADAGTPGGRLESSPLTPRPEDVPASFVAC